MTSQQRPKQMTIRLTQAEYADIADKAGEIGITITEWMRNSALERRMPRRDMDTKAVIRELNKIGVNLNQAVKLMHQTGDTRGAKIERTMARLEKALLKIAED